MLNISDQQLLALAAQCRKAQRLVEAEGLCRQVLQQEQSPAWISACDLLGRVLLERGCPAEAAEAFRRGMELGSPSQEVDDLLLIALHALAASTPESLFEEHLRWASKWTQPLTGLIRPHGNERSPERRLRIGYVSQDFRCQPIGVFMLPLLAAHDRKGFEVFCYSQCNPQDAVTASLQAQTDGWRNTVNLSDHDLAELIRADGIDILVDLSLHSVNNRLVAFAYKPAPVQATFLGYCSTTGLEAMDYRITDPYLDPPEAPPLPFCETPIRLPRTYWSYRPLIPTPAVGPLPAGAAGTVTFASLNSLSKVSEVVLGAWVEILRAVPRSRLVIHARESPRSQHVDAFFAAQGIDLGRIAYVGYVSLPEYFQLYTQVDIALDSFPWGGGTTTCDALCMGVPVVSLAGQTGVSRGGLSILSNVGLPELVASTPGQYAAIAADLAGDLPRLAHLRSTLRQRMAQSPLMDTPAYARHLEALYRQMWRTWCLRPQGG